MAEITVYADGLCEPNPGGWACWAWVAFMDGREISHAYGTVGHGDGISNNISEYEAVLQALRRAEQKGKHIQLYTDSKLVVNQVNGEWAVRAQHLQPLCAEGQRLLRATASTLAWVRREQNQAADVLTRKAYQDATGHTPPTRRKVSR